MTTVIRTTRVLVHALLHKVFDYVSDLPKHPEWSGGDVGHAIWYGGWQKLGKSLARFTQLIIL